MTSLNTTWDDDLQKTKKKKKKKKSNCTCSSSSKNACRNECIKRTFILQFFANVFKFTYL